MKRRREFKPYCSILRAALLSGRIRMERERDMPNGLDFKSLKDKQQKLRDGFPDNVSLRIHRSLSWIERAGTGAGDDDAAILFYWIAFNAAYAVDAGKRDWKKNSERGSATNTTNSLARSSRSTPANAPTMRSRTNCPSP